MSEREELIQDVERQISNLSTDPATNVANRPTLEDIAADQGMSRAKFNRLYNILYNCGPGEGKFLSLPFDQRVEHGAGHQFKWDRGARLDSVVELANKGDFSALVLSMGETEKMQNRIKPDIGVICKMDGHFRVGSSEEVPFHRHTNFGSVKRALDAGADAIGLTFYVGSQNMQEDIERISEVVEEAHYYQLPVVIWAYARGPMPGRVGVDSLYWCHMAVSAAQSVGADVVKTKFPSATSDIDAYEHMLFGDEGAEGFKNGGGKGFVSAKMKEGAWAYWQLEQAQNPEAGFTHEEHVRRMNLVMQAADRAFVVVSGGPKAGGSAEETLVESTRAVMDAGGEGRIIGRNFWGVPIEEGLRLQNVVSDVMADEKYDRELTGPRFVQ